MEGEQGRMMQPLRSLASFIDAKFDALPSHRRTRLAYYLKQRLDLLWMVLNACTCGSGAHPRRCKRHPWAYRQHCDRMDHDTLLDTIEELESRIAILEQENEIASG